MNHQPTAVVATLGGGLVNMCDAMVANLGIVQGRLPNQPAPAVVTKQDTSHTPPPLPAKSQEDRELQQALAAAKAAVEKAHSHPRRTRRLANTPLAQPAPEPVVQPAPEPPQSAETAVVVAEPVAHKKLPEAKLDAFSDFVAAFHEAVRVEFPECPFARPGRVRAKPGTLYTVTPAATKKVRRWYCVSESGRDLAVAALKYKSRTGLVDVLLPIPFERFEEELDPATFQKLEVVPVDEGFFRTKCQALEQADMALVAAVLGKMLDLPKW